MRKSHTLNLNELKEHGFELPAETTPEFHVELFKRMKKAFVLAHLTKAKYNITEASQTIGVPIATLYKLMRQLGIPTKRVRTLRKGKELATRGKTT